jgi:hypothetical protein
VDSTLEPGSTVEVTLDIVGKLFGRVKWQVGNRVGVVFDSVPAGTADRIRRL